MNIPTLAVLAVPTRESSDYAFAMQLLDQIESLRRELAQLETHPVFDTLSGRQARIDKMIAANDG